MKTICMILKAPRAGTVKTRLAKDIGSRPATAIYRALVEHQARAIPPEWNVSVYFAPRDALMEMEAWLKPHLAAPARFIPQCDGDLGQRLAAVVRAECQRGTTRVFLIGGDCPSITTDYFSQSDKLLNDVDLVVGPAADGGYVLLGLKSPHEALFKDIAWSTSAVLGQTIEAAKQRGLSIALLPELEDIDDANALNHHSTHASSWLSVESLEIVAPTTTGQRGK